MISSFLKFLRSLFSKRVATPVRAETQIAKQIGKFLATAKCNCEFNEGHEPWCDIVLANKMRQPVHPSIVGVINRANLDAPKWEVIRQTRPLTDEDIAEHGPNCESGVMKSWSVPLEPPVDGRMFQPMRQRWDAEARIIYVERMA